ncbi:hypothetical protein JOD54_001492 [Actinokineospora baliensis]|uniref:hypothetical protein n=1 Tax=Actinokineospora baliensis TaxID=547056 RepID=UPI00195B23B1|nr:hypothetical protein [Actinokineospora baliensis]MBM7771288.1 hypothetical protein [Actinokineospora baliensis]
MSEEFTRRSLLCVDARNYSGGDDRRQQDLQRHLDQLMGEAAAAAGLDRREWSVQERGDGELDVLPLGTSESRLIDEFPRELAHLLQLHNHGRSEETRLRLRLSLHQGMVGRGPGGFPGQAVVAVARLVDSPAAKAAQNAIPAANLVLVVSNTLYSDLVAQRHTKRRPEEFRRIDVRVKEYTETAWLHLPEFDIGPLDLGPDDPTPPSPPDDRPGPVDHRPRAEPEPASAAPPSVATVVHGGIRSDTAIFGNNFGPTR